MIFAEKRYHLGSLVILSISSFFLGRYMTTLNPSNNHESCPDPVRDRLLESNEIWLRGVARRNELAMTHPINEKDQWSFNKETSFYDFFYPTFDCPHTVERVGTSGDGGKWLCGIRHIGKYSLNSPCVVYSYGISYETSFEEEILQRTKCSVYMFDHTINVTEIELPRKYPGRAFIEKIGLGIDDTNKELRSLKSQLQKNGHRFLEILKFDVEGAEIGVLNSFKEQFPKGLPFGQLAVELHLLDGPNALFYPTYRDWMSNMENMGLRAFRNELNFLALKRTPSHNPTYCEYSFINVKGDHNLLHS